MRLRLTIAYTGTRYSGWQIQEKPNPPRTVQGMLEAAFARVLQNKVRLHGAGRTDAGVHAEAQVAHVDIPEKRRQLPWQRIINNSLPEDIALMQVQEADPAFHARFDACGKVYTYQIWREAQCVPPRLAPFVWACPYSLNPERLQAALPYFVGEHDFASLQNAGTDLESTVRSLHSLNMQWEQASPLVTLRVQGSGFLKQMVRNMVGMLAAAASGKIAVDFIPQALALRDRSRLPFIVTAPAQGLTLSKVLYPDSL